MPPEPQSWIPLGRIGPHTHGQERPGSSQQMKQVACHICRWCIPAYRRPGDCAFRHERSQALVYLEPSCPVTCRHVDWKVGVAGQLVTRFVSLCCFDLPQRRHHVRQEDGRYLLGTVPPVQDQVMLPACVRADSTKVLDRIATFASAVLNDKVIFPAGATSRPET